MSAVIRNGVTASTKPRAGLDHPEQQQHAGAASRALIAGVFLWAFYAGTAGMTTAAHADTIQIPAITFVNRAGTAGAVLGDANAGVLTNAAGTFYAAVPFAADGAVVCKFVLVHRDNDGDGDVTARLLKKRIVIGGAPFADAPVEMAKAQSTGSTAGIQKVADTSIKQPTINLSRGLYYVELTIDNAFIDVLGVEIVVRPVC